MLKFLQIFQRLHFDLSFADALFHIPKFAIMFKNLLSNKEKLFELENTPLTENCLASVKLMPLSVWKKLSLPDLTSTRMTLELATRSYAYPAGIAEDVFVKVSKLTFPSDFVIVDYDVNPCVPLILGRPFLRTDRALVDDHFPKVLKFKKSNHPSSGSTTPLFDSSPSLIPFETSNSLLEEFADELALLDPIPPRKKDNSFDFEVDLREIEFLMHQDPSTESNIETIDPILKKLTDEPSLDYLPPPGDDDDDLFDLKSDNDEWKKIFLNTFVEIPYGEIKVHIEVLSVLWGNRLPILNGSLQLSRDLQKTNIDQLHAYLGQHEFHTNKGRHTSSATGTSRTYTSGASGNNFGKQRIVVYNNCKGEGHMSKQCTKPKKKRDESWFKDKVLLVQAQANGQILHEEELAFLADPWIAEAQTT
nr:hypothetical protein [Tanacetum cinerariifolium]